MGELVVAHPVISLATAVSLPLDLISTLSLLYRAGPGSGLDPWLLATRRALPDDTRYDLDILEGFTGRLLYYLEEPVNRFDPLAPQHRDASFADLLDFMTDLTPTDFLEMAIGAVQRVRADEGLDTTVPDLDRSEGDRDRDLAWRRFLEPALTTATADDVIPLLEQPERLRLRTINLFRVVWTIGYRDEYLRQADLLNEAAERASDILHEGFGRVFGELTGARMPATLANRLQDINEITFHPSVHLGNFLSFVLSPPRGIIFFDARRFLGRSRSASRSGPLNPADPADSRTSRDFDPWATVDIGVDGAQSESAPASRQRQQERAADQYAAPIELLEGDQLVESARALGDPTRLRILELIGDGERYAQEIVTALDIAQSAVSRHLSLLERSGLVSVRPQRGMKYYSVDTEFASRLIRTLQQRLVGTR